MKEEAKRNRAQSILVLVAALDEEEGIRLTLDELRHYLPSSTFLVVDGYSGDRTADIAKDLGAEVLFQEGKGKGDAIAVGLRHSKHDFDYLVLTDADYTYPAAYIPQMISVLEENSQVGMVCGNRFNSRLHMGTMKDYLYFGNRLIAFVHNLFNGVALQDPLTGLRVVRWDIVKNWEPKSVGFDVEVELNHHVERQGYNIMEIEIPYRHRLGQKKLKMRHGVTIIKRILSERVSLT